MPGRRFLYDRAARPMLRIADSILGSDLLERIAEFLVDLRTTYDGVAQRGREIEGVMRESSILVVTTADPAPVREAVKFYRELPKLAATPAAVIFNRALPDEWVDARPGSDVSPELRQMTEMWGAETLRQRDTREGFSARYGATVATVPWSMTPPNDLNGLADLMEEASGVPWEEIGIAEA